MKKDIWTAILVFVVISRAAVAGAQNLTDIGTASPTPGPNDISQLSTNGNTAATIDFPDIGLQGFAPKLAKGEIASLTLCKNRLPPTAENHPCET